MEFAMRFNLRPRRRNHGVFEGTNLNYPSDQTLGMSVTGRQLPRGSGQRESP
jgi:hypothetical protein